ncbi:hypothetical protein QR680_009555 [Steinernema hermaphroditum]|uniref:C3H1-type domain-containing protein n=1 Tax=Steinernema hermaphroditum TaxID=289476 RepID=A0AA39IKR5_9BILA|nr:hypothetical protein QR680_009555 [Steinernema hermaphroditum]
MAEPMSDDDGEVIDRISSSSPEDISEEIEPFPQRNKRPPMTPPTPENCENIEDDISDVEPSPPQPADISSDSNNADDNDNLDYSDGEGDASEQLLNREGSSVPVEETEDKKELSDGELEEGELESDSEDEVEGATLKDNKEKSDSRSPSRSPPPKSRNDGICKFYLRGNCTWGVTCKFYHPTDAECEQLRREEGIDGRRSITRVYQRAASPAKEEDAWERGLKQARERMKKASELKKDPDFDKKRLLMSASDASPRRRSDSEDSLDRKRSSSPGGAREKSRRIPDPVPFFPVGSSGRPPSLIDVMRNEDRRRNEAVKDLGPQVLYPSRDRDRNRNRRSHDNKTAPVPLREVAGAPKSETRRSGGQSLRERCRQRDNDQPPKRNRNNHRSRSNRSSADESERRGRKRRRERSRSCTHSLTYSSRESSKNRSSSVGSCSSSSSRSSSRSSVSRSRSSSRSSEESQCRDRRNRKHKADAKRKTVESRDPTVMRSNWHREKEREPSSAADLSSFRIPKRRRSQRSESRSRSPVNRNRRQSSGRTKPQESRKKRSSEGDDRAPAAYRSNADPLFGLQGVPLSPEGDPISSDDEPDPKRDEVIRERDRIDDISDSSGSSSGSSSDSSSSEGEEERKSRSSSAAVSRTETPPPPEVVPELDDKERRRQELLDQLRSVEEAIARKRNKLTA